MMREEQPQSVTWLEGDDRLVLDLFLTYDKYGNDCMGGEATTESPAEC